MIYKKGRYHMVKFKWQGKVIRKSTRATSLKNARSIEAQIKAELAKSNFGILEAKSKQTLSEFLTKDFVPFTEGKFKDKKKTLDYYLYGVKSMLSSDLSKMKLDEITDQQAAQYAARNSHLTPSTINCGLRTLRRALNLAEEWGKLDRSPKIRLAKGERQRERVLRDDEAIRYLEACPQPWRDVATIILGTAMRPGEIFPLRWEDVAFNGNKGLVRLTEGKSKAARRALPMMPVVYRVLKSRYEEQNSPRKGWVFPANSRSGHVGQGTTKKQHATALRKSKVKRFEPYCLRHTALTNLADSGCDTYTLARIAGHSNISMTQRYCHPQADAIERAFTQMTSVGKGVTEGGHLKKLPHNKSKKIST